MSSVCRCKMSFVVRMADLSRDCQTIINLHVTFLSLLADNRRFEWLYLNNPVGQPKTWLISEANTDIIVGTAAAFPRILYRGKEKVIGWVLGDFCINDRYRALGPAVLLQRACLEGVRLEKKSIWYDFPSTTMLAVYKRLHIASSFSMLRLAKPLRVDRKMQTFAKNKVLVKGVSYIANRILEWKNQKPKERTDISLSLHQGECGEEFTELAESVGGQWGYCMYRSASYLNWRYVRSPLGRYCIGTAWKNGKLLTYLVFTQIDEDALIVDILGIQDFPIIQSLIQWTVRELSQKNITTVSVSLSDQHPLIPIFQNLGFQIREASPIVVAEAGNNASPLSKNDFQSRWCLMQGDRDV